MSSTTTTTNRPTSTAQYITSTNMAFAGPMVSDSTQNKKRHWETSSAHPPTPPRSSESSGKRAKATPSTQSPSTSTVSSTSNSNIQQSYLHLLMPEPPPDHLDNDMIEQMALWRCILLGRRRNKDWRNTLVFDEVDDEDDELVNPLRHSPSSQT